MDTGTRKRDQIQADLHTAILDGHLGPGDALPSARELCTRYNVSRITVRRALERLAAAGLIDMRQGARARVRTAPLVKIAIDGSDWRRHRDAGRPGFNATVAEHGIVGRQEVLDVQHPLPAPHYVADALGLDDDAPMVMRFVRMYADDVPVRLVRTWFPAEWAAGTLLAEWPRIRGGAARFAEELHGRFVATVVDLEGRNPTEEEVVLLSLARGISVIHMVTTCVTADERQVYVQEEIADASRHRWRFRVAL